MNDSVENLPQKYFLHSMAKHSHAIEQLCDRAERSIKLYSPNLLKPIFHREAISKNLLRLIKSHPKAEVHIIICDSASLLRTHHSILELARRLPSRIHIRKLQSDNQPKNSYLLIDNECLWLAHDEKILDRENSGFYLNAKTPDSKTYQENFTDLWEASENTPELRQLTI